MIIRNAGQAMPAGLYGPLDPSSIVDPDLAIIDEILDDPTLIDIVHQSICRNSSSNPFGGPKRMALNRILRCLALKHIKNWSFPVLHNELLRNLDYRAFTQFYDQPIPARCTIFRNCALVDGKGIEQLNAHLRTVAQEKKLIKGKSLRSDTTVCETNIHHPTDSSILRDGQRVLGRLVKQAEALVPCLPKMRDWSRAALHRVLEINRASKSKGEKAKRQRRTAYESMMRMMRRIVTHAQKVQSKLGDKRTTRRLSLIDHLACEGVRSKLQTMIPRVDTVIRQTRARICNGDTKYPGKILSLFETESAAIRKGKAHKPTEFGRVVEINEVESGFVSDYQIHDGNPADAPMLLPSIRRHIQHFGSAPQKVATDRGLWSAENEKKAYEMKVKRVSIPFRGKLSSRRRALQRKRWWRALQRWRAGGEGRIGILKNNFGLDRCLYGEDRGMKRWVGGCVFGNNLMVVARKLRNKKRDHKGKS